MAATTGSTSTNAGGTTVGGTAVAPGMDGKPSDRYSDLTYWHCHPDKRDDVCDTADLAATEVSATGRKVLEHKPAAAPTIDCFYVYPTVDTSPVAGVRSFSQPVNPLEAIVVQNTFARFDEVCRPFAPRYEQMTGAGYRDGRAAELLAIGDAQVEEAFDHYLATQNNGRPFVLMGHSQGTHHLIAVMKKRFEGDAGAALRSKLVSALLLGPVGYVVVPTGKLVGGTFSSLPLCSRPDETACVVAYDSFAVTHPPTAGGLAAGMDRACTNPADLTAGDRAVPLAGPYLTQSTDGVTTPTEVWPNFYTARCTRDSAGQPFLEIAAAPAPGDPREERLFDRFVPTLHLVDPNLAMRDLLDLVARQAKVVTSARPR